MVRGEKTKGMVVMLLFFGTAIVNAAPTINDSDGDIFLCARPSGLYEYPNYRQDIGHVTGLFNSQLDSISKEFHRPPVKNGESQNTYMGVKSLPPAPKTLLMVLVGFLCVSLVKDRRVWLAALAGLLWAGQAGVSILPQLAANIAGRGRSEKQSSAHQVAHLTGQKHPYRLRSDIEGTCYIGLLRHLEGIPKSGKSFIPNTIVRHKLQQGTERISIWSSFRTCSSSKSLQSLANHKFFALPKNNFQKENRYCGEESHSAIAAFSSYLFHATECLAPGARQHVLYSSAFIIASLARGPPNFK